MKEIKVTCAIIEYEGQVLVTQRSAAMAQPLLWEFPGGKLEPNESEIDCLIREIKEELSVTIVPHLRLNPVSYSYSDKAILLIPYICTFVKGNIVLAEHAMYEWVHPDSLVAYNWCPADLPIVEEYLKLR